MKSAAAWLIKTEGITAWRWCLVGNMTLHAIRKAYYDGNIDALLLAIPSSAILALVDAPMSPYASRLISHRLGQATTPGTPTPLHPYVVRTFHAPCSVFIRLLDHLTGRHSLSVLSDSQAGSPVIPPTLTVHIDPKGQHDAQQRSRPLFLSTLPRPPTPAY